MFADLAPSSRHGWAQVQATWFAERALFLWSLDSEASGVLGTVGVERGAAILVLPDGKRVVRAEVQGVRLPLARALPFLVSLQPGSTLSDALHCWRQAALLGLELAAQHRVVPTVRDERAQWRALLTRPADRERVHALVRALPVAARAAPLSESGVRIATSEQAIIEFVDAAIDTTYRQLAWPGAARGWILELAEALRGEDATFRPREARHRGIPAVFASWWDEAAESTVSVAFRLEHPEQDSSQFKLALLLRTNDGQGHELPLAEAWSSGARLELGGSVHRHAAQAALRGLARAIGLHPPLRAAITGSAPTDLSWTPAEAARFLEEGRPILQSAGYPVEIPEAFARAGRKRLQTRIRIHVPAGPEVDLSAPLRYRWEVALGERVLEPAELRQLLARPEPLVRFGGTWVHLDPADLERVPSGTLPEGTLEPIEALRAVLVGEHRGVPVVADDSLALWIELLRSPPEIEVPNGFAGALRPYQLRGASWLATLGRLGLGACLADDMGLGKTVQVIVHLLSRRRGPTRGQRSVPSLVVCPTSVLGNWQRELARFAPKLDVARYHGSQRPTQDLGEVDVVLTSYGLLVRDQTELASRPWDVVVLDEAQAIKNPESQRARAARTLKARHRIALSGTPVENRLDELWSLVDFLIPTYLGTRSQFQREMAVPIERFGDERAAVRLKAVLSPFLMRRLKSDPTVIDDLPDKIEGRQYCGLTPEQARLYQQIVDDEMAAITGANAQERRGRVLAMLTRLKQVCNHPAQLLGESRPLDGRSGKLDRCADLIDTIVANRERALVFTQYREMGLLLQTYLSERLGRALPFLHGGTPPGARDSMVDAFQSGRGAPVLLVSLRAGGTGLNLTAATHVVHYDRWWNPAVEDQATDRAYRIGQHKNVHVHKLVSQDTLEERIDLLLEDKRALAQQVIGSGETWLCNLSDEALRQLVVLGAEAVSGE